MMGRTLELPDEVYEALEQAAKASGTDPVDWIATHLHEAPENTPAKEARTLADLFAGRVGRIRSGGQENLLLDRHPSPTPAL